MSPSIRSSCFFLAILAAAPPALARPQDPGVAETRALELKAAGDYRAATEAFFDLLARPTGDELAAARAEFHATMACLVAGRAGIRSAAGRLVERAGTAEREGWPFLRDHCLQLALELAVRHGDHSLAAELTAALGYVGEWLAIGPFDNERGSGWARAFEPERELDLDATYDGKKRPVRWRACEVANPPAGVFDLDALFEPDDQVLAYAACALVAERPTSAVLHLGSDEAFKVLLNGVEVAGRDVRRRFAADQDAVPLELAAGANLLLLKICDLEGAFAFAARLRAPDGRPLAGVAPTIDPGALAAAAATAARPPAASVPPRGARSVLARHVEDTGDPRDALRLATLLAMNHADDPTDRRDRQLAMRAVEALPDLPAARYLLAFTRVREGSAEERDENPRRHDYQLLLAQHGPSQAEAARALAELELESGGLANRAADILVPVLEHHPDFRGGQLTLAAAWDRLGLDELARMLVRDAAAPADDGVRDPAATVRWFDLLVRERRWREAAALADARLTAAFDADGVVGAAEVHLRLGERERAVALLERGIAHLPFARRPRQTLARLHEAEQDLDAALRVLGEWLRICPEDDEVLSDVARLHGLDGDVERQRETLRSVVELNPNRKVERRHLEFLLADEVPFYAAFAIDAAIPGADAVPPDAAAAHDPYFHMLRHDVIHAYRNGTQSRYHHRVVRVLTEQGARDLSTFFVPHYWGEQRARLLAVRVVRADGQEVRPQLGGSYVRMPPLAPGDTCEIRYRVDDLAPGYFGDYFGLEHRFSSRDGSPTGRAVLDLVLDSGRDYRLQTRNGAPEPDTRALDGAIVHHFEMQELPRRKPEERRPDLDETEPLVRVTTYRDWDDFSSWWWNLIRKQSEMTAEMRAKVEELIAGAETELEKIDAIYRFVTTDIQYKAWEFGVHGYQPYSTPVIFERRHGDCKDKALLLNAMLGSIGIEAYPVLIHADPRRSADDLSLALVQHFNHCISWLPPAGGRAAMFLDGTATYHPVDTLPEMDQGAEVLVVSARGGDLQTIEWVDAAANVDRRRFVVELDRSGDAIVTMIHEPRRNEAVPVRQALANEPAKQTEAIARELSDLFGSVEVLSVQTSDLLDLEAPVRVEVRFRCTELAPAHDGVLTLRAGFVDESLQALTSAAEREFALLLGVPRTDAQTVVYRLPDGFAPVELPPPTRVEERFGSFRSEWRRDEDGSLRIERMRALDANRIEPQEYASFREFAATIDDADRRVVLIGRRKS